MAEYGRGTTMRIGVSQVDITPQAGTQIGGAVGLHRPAEVVMDPIYAKALVVECNNRKLCLVTVDATIITERFASAIRKAAVEQLGFEYDAVMVHALQVHSSPPIGHFLFRDKTTFGHTTIAVLPEYEWIRGADDRNNALAVERTIESIRQANDSLQPVYMGVGSGIEGRVAFNRRAIMRDGSVGMPFPWDYKTYPVGNNDILYIEGPMDPEVGVVCFRTDSLEIPAMLVNYTCHPVCVYIRNSAGRIISADWPGAWADELKKRYGSGCIPVVSNGACGNINPIDPFNPNMSNGTDHLYMGRLLADMTERVITDMRFRDNTIIDWKSRHINIPVKEVPAQELEAAMKLLEEHPEPMWVDDNKTHVDIKWCMALSTVNVHLNRESEPELDYEVQVFRIGDTAFVGLPGEPFVEGGLKIKLDSPVRHTYIVHCVNQYPGYLPTNDGAVKRGHESSVSVWSKLGPEALDMVVDTAVDMLNEMFAE